MSLEGDKRSPEARRANPSRRSDTQAGNPTRPVGGDAFPPIVDPDKKPNPYASYEEKPAGGR
ncbi:MAG TPA: hypothetical protein VF189_01440 [Patescibacteria group bacterium]